MNNTAPHGKLFERKYFIKIFQVWWEAVPLRQKVIGYEVFYSMTAVEDLDQWQRKTVGLTTSIDLVNLERHSQVSGDLLEISRF